MGTQTARTRTLSELQRELTDLRKQVFGGDRQNNTSSVIMPESEADSANQIAFVVESAESSKVTLVAASSTLEKAIATE